MTLPASQPENLTTIGFSSKISPKPALWPVFRALESRNFRLFITGQLISQIGTWMQQMAMGWLVYRLTHSVSLLGLTTFCTQGPGFFIAPWAGMLADRLNRRNILVATQSLAMLQAFALAWLTLQGHVQVWQILALGVCLGMINGMDVPARQSFVVEMLDRPETLSNAISLNSSVFNGTRLIGPAIAGIAIQQVGEGWCFFLNGLSYLAVIGALGCMRMRAKASEAKRAGYLESLQAGFVYAYRHSPIRAILTLVAVVSLVGLPYSTLVPVYARDILHGDAKTLGLLMGATGAGALTAAIYLASRQNALGLLRLIPLAAGGFGLGLTGFAFARILWLALPLIYMLGFCMMLQLASSNILLQTLAEESKRGRVMSLYTMSFMGMTPFGSLLIGAIAGKVGVSPTLLTGGLLCMVGAACFARHLPGLLQVSRTERTPSLS